MGLHENMKPNFSFVAYYWVAKSDDVHKFSGKLRFH